MVHTFFNIHTTFNVAENENEVPPGQSAQWASAEAGSGAAAAAGSGWQQEQRVRVAGRAPATSPWWALFRWRWGESAGHLDRTSREVSARSKLDSSEQARKQKDFREIQDDWLVHGAEKRIPSNIEMWGER